MRTLKTLMWALQVVAFFVIPLAVLLSVALWWGIVRGLALSGAIVLTTYFVASVLRNAMPVEDDSDDDGDGGEPDEDEVPPPDVSLLFEVTQPERETWRN